MSYSLLFFLKDGGISLSLSLNVFLCLYPFPSVWLILFPPIISVDFVRYRVLEHRAHFSFSRTLPEVRLQYCDGVLLSRSHENGYVIRLGATHARFCWHFNSTWTLPSVAAWHSNARRRQDADLYCTSRRENIHAYTQITVSSKANRPINMWEEFSDGVMRSVSHVLHGSLLHGEHVPSHYRRNLVWRWNAFQTKNKYFIIDNFIKGYFWVQIRMCSRSQSRTSISSLWAGFYSVLHLKN